MATTSPGTRRPGRRPPWRSRLEVPVLGLVGLELRDQPLDVGRRWHRCPGRRARRTARHRGRGAAPSALCLAVAWSSFSWPALVASLALARPISAWALTLSMSPMTPPRVVVDDGGLRLGRGRAAGAAFGGTRPADRPPRTRSRPCAPGVTIWKPDDPLAADDRPGAPGLTVAGTLLHRWARPVGGRPRRPPCGSEGGRWWTAGEFDAATRRAAGRLRAAGLEPGRAGGVVHAGRRSTRWSPTWAPCGPVWWSCPANTAYTERELAHIVTDVRAVGRRGGPTRPGRAGSGTRRPAPMVVCGPDLDLPDGDPGGLDGAGPDDPALICFTSGTTGAPKGAVLRHRNLLAGVGVGDPGLADGTRGPAGPLPPGLPRPRPGGRGVRDADGRGVGRAAAGVRPGRGGRRGRATSGRPSSSGCPPCTTGWSPPDGPPTCRACACAFRDRRRCRPTLHAAVSAAVGQPRPRALRHDRDPDEHVQSLRRRAPGRHGRLPPARRGGGARPDRARSCCGAPTCSTATSSATPPTPRRSATSATAEARGSPPATWATTTTATWSSGGGPRSSSSPAGSTSTRPRSRTCWPAVRGWPRWPSPARRPTSGARR